DCISRRERQNGRGEKRDVEQTGSEEDEGEIAGERLHRTGSVRGHLNVAHAVDVEGGRAGDDDEPCDEIGEEAADYDIEARGLVLADRDALLHDGRLQIKLHPRHYGSADDSNDHVDIVMAPPDVARRQHHGGFDGFGPIRMTDETGGDIGEIENAGGEEYLFDNFVIFFYDQQPHDDRADGHADVLGHVEELHGTG